MVLGEEAVDLGVVVRRETQSAAGEVDEQFARHRFPRCASLVDVDGGVDAEFADHCDDVVGGGLCWPLDAVEVTPEIVERALRVGASDFHHDACLGVLGELTDELFDRGDVVDDVVGGDDGVPTHLERDLGPPPMNRPVAHPRPDGLLVELGQHLGAGVESGDRGRGRDEWDARRAAAAPDVQQRAATAEAGKRLAPRRWRAGLMVWQEQLGRDLERALRRLFENPPGNRPTGER